MSDARDAYEKMLEAYRRAEVIVAARDAVVAAAIASVRNPAWHGVCDEDVALEQAVRRLEAVSDGRDADGA